jgi:hypothetical protein
MRTISDAKAICASVACAIPPQHPVALSDKLLKLFTVHLVGAALGPVRTAEPLLAIS